MGKNDIKEAASAKEAAPATVKLTEVTPDREELAEARRVLANSTDLAKRSKMASMVHWLKVHGGDANADAKDSRGEKRKEFLLLHMVMVMREKRRGDRKR